MKILMTGFEPFGGSPLNPSEKVVRSIQADPPAGVDLATCILPVDGARSPQALLDALEVHHPGAVICLGEASGRAAISLERIALNLLDYRIPDNAGITQTDKPVRTGGPAAYFSTLPLRSMQSALIDAGIPCELSLSAGAYLCNQVFYTLMDTVLGIPAGFIHLPSLPEQMALRGVHQPSMALETMLRAVRILLDCVKQTNP